MSDNKNSNSSRAFLTREGWGWVPDLLAILFFVAISLIYFLGPIRDGKVLAGQDHDAAIGSGVEMEQYRAAHNGERTRWTNTLFSGMPTYQMSPSYSSTDKLSKLESIYRLGLPTVASYVFMMLLGFYILMRAFDFRVWMSALGAILWAFSSYYFIIIQAGHIWKLLTLSFIPPTIAGMVLCYRGKYMLGIVVTGIFTALQILSNHVQMTYYFLFVIGFMSLAYLIDAIRQKTLKQWFRATACFAVGGILGVCINLSNLYHTWEYSKESMRGKSELTQKTKDPADQTSGGLERSYITAWSYGIGETWTLLVPNTKGGASVPLAANEEAMKHADNQFMGIYRQMGQYWGEQPGTSGPVYVGAFVLFLFILGLFIVKGPMKWCLLAATILSILLSWGKNFMPFTDFFLDYIPMYDKFRTVASILVIAEFTIPLLAMMALKEIVRIKNGDVSGNVNNSQLSTLNSQLIIAFAVTAGMCFLFWLMPDLFFGNYISTQETMALQGLTQNGVPQTVVAQLMANLSEMRQAMFTADAMRSFIIIVVGTLILLVYRWGKIKTVPMVACIILLCLADMWGINKRYLNDSMFVTPRTNAQAFPPSQADQLILQDADKYYRVVNLTVSTFNDNTTSYFHKSIGGYHAAKLRRYQELIEEHITSEMRALQQAAVQSSGLLETVNGDSLYPVLNMLNTKYAILGGKDGGKIPVLNPWANGNAWFVNKVQYVDDADAELAALRGLDTKHIAVVDKKFQQVLGEEALQPDSTAQVTLKEYEANRLTYEVNSQKGGIVVFSEIYYPGWTCSVDGAATQIARADYVLRAIRIPAGKHTVVMTFDPQTVHVTETIAYCALAVLAVLLIAFLYISYLRPRRAKAE